MSDAIKKSRAWIPWVIAALAVSINLFSAAIGYGGDKQTIKDTAAALYKHCEKQEIKEQKTDTVLNALGVQVAVAQAQNAMILESLTALRKELKEGR
jgi:hypothetical protein